MYGVLSTIKEKKMGVRQKKKRKGGKNGRKTECGVGSSCHSYWLQCITTGMFWPGSSLCSVLESVFVFIECGHNDNEFWVFSSCHY